MEVDFEELMNQQQDLNDSILHPETARILTELDRKTASRKLAVPTNLNDIKIKLRELNQPVTLFGERPEDRRDRLRDVMSKIALAVKEKKVGEGGIDGEESDDSSDSGIEDDEEKEEEFYTEGTLELKRSRRDMTDYSIARAQRRIAKQRKESTLPLGRLIDVRRAVFTDLKTFTNLGSQIGDTRPLSSLRFSPDSSMLLTGSWSGAAKLWDVPNCKEIKLVKAHKERIGGVAWHPQATLSQSKTEVNFATSGAEGEVKLWSLEGDPLLTLKGHSSRVCRIAFHPSGKYLGSASFDGTWRLWDAEKGGEELLLQEGHSKEVYAIAFQEDGALVCTGGLDAIGRVWDLRSGKTAMVLDGHVKDILAIDFSPNGHQIATGSNDDTIKLWDMRTLKTIYTIPAHKSAVSDLKFFNTSSLSTSTSTISPSNSSKTIIPSAYSNLPVFTNSSNSKSELEDSEMNGEVPEIEDEKIEMEVAGLFLVSSGYDGKVKIWSADDWQLIKSMTSDENGKVMSVDVSSDAKLIASAEYSRTYKLFSNPTSTW